jgi:hypothetical protein
MSDGAISGSPNMQSCNSNPNGLLAGFSKGMRYAGAPPDLAWDGGNFWVCTMTGTVNTAVWSTLTTTSVATIVNHQGLVSEGILTIDRRQGPVQRATVGGPLTIVLIGFIANAYSDIEVELTNGGSQTLTWPTTINWVSPATGALTPSFTTYGVSLQTAGTDFIVFWSPDGGTTIFGKVVR